MVYTVAGVLPRVPVVRVVLRALALLPKGSIMLEIIVSAVYLIGLAIITAIAWAEFRHLPRPQTQPPALAEDKPKQAMAA